MLTVLFIALKRLFYGDGGYLLRKNLKSPRRILVTRLQHLGDVAVFLPFLSSLRKAYPEAKIFALSKHKTGYELLRRCPFLDGVFRSERWGFFDKVGLWWWMWNNPVNLFVVSTQD
ncbi:MAG: hypothetical protein N2234_04255, partial [Planctomycetota bacterium]|nr:hypothetical protein [Planctomycetota bacterium]